MTVLDKVKVGYYTFRKVGNTSDPRFRATGVGSFKLSNHSGLGGGLKKARFTQKQIKEVYAFLRKPIN